jgi:hypothetical protein
VRVDNVRVPDIEEGVLQEKPNQYSAAYKRVVVLLLMTAYYAILHGEI